MKVETPWPYPDSSSGMLFRIGMMIGEASKMTSLSNLPLHAKQLLEKMYSEPGLSRSGFYPDWLVKRAYDELADVLYPRRSMQPEEDVQDVNIGPGMKF